MDMSQNKLSNLERATIVLTCPCCGKNIETDVSVTVTRVVSPEPQSQAIAFPDAMVKSGLSLDLNKTQPLSDAQAMEMIDNLSNEVVGPIEVLEGLAPDVLTNGMEVEVKIPEWLRRDKDLLSAHLVGEVKTVTKKAILFKGRVKTGYSQSCFRCGREITNPVSRMVGYGPWCSEQLGIPRDMDEEQAQEWLERHAESEVKELWLPLSRIEIKERI